MDVRRREDRLLDQLSTLIRRRDSALQIIKAHADDAGCGILLLDLQAALTSDNE
jgi:hypothetical protein